MIVEIALVLSLAFTGLGFWIASAAEEVREAMRIEALARAARAIDLKPDPVEIDFGVFWDEVDPGYRVTSLPVEIKGMDGAVQAQIEGEGRPEISVGKGEFTSGPVEVFTGQTIRVQITVPTTLGEIHGARLMIGERTVSVRVRSRRQGAFAFDHPDGRLSAVPARGEILRIPVDLSTVYDPSLRIDPPPPEGGALTFEMAVDGIAVICAMPETCSGEHPVSLRVTAAKLSEGEKDTEARKSDENRGPRPEGAMVREIAADYTLDITENAPLGFPSDSDLGVVEAHKGVLAQIELTTRGVQGAYVELETAPGKDEHLRLLRSAEDRVDLICDSPAGCVGQHAFFARAESWNPHLVVRRRFEIEVTAPKTGSPDPETAPDA